jgi:hypothetical protein
MGKLLFHELIEQLKKVKSERDVSPELVEELISASIAGAVLLVQEDKKDTPNMEALEVARMIVLKNFDKIIINTMLDEVRGS